MKSLFNDFKNYVDAMDIQAVKKNIQEAVEHSADSHILDGQIDENKNSSKNVSTQQMSIIHCYHIYRHLYPNNYLRQYLYGHPN